MDPNTFPTKGNLILAKNSLALAKQGYVLMDKKRNILIRELMGLIEQAEDIQKDIDKTFRMAYAALQKANIKLGISLVEEISYSVPIENYKRCAGSGKGRIRKGEAAYHQALHDRKFRLQTGK